MSIKITRLWQILHQLFWPPFHDFKIMLHVLEQVHLFIIFYVKGNSICHKMTH